MLFSVKPQHESAKGTHISPPKDVSLLIPNSTGSSNQCNKARKGNERHTVYKGKNECVWSDLRVLNKSDTS